MKTYTDFLSESSLSRVNGRAFVFESNTLTVLEDYPPTEIRSIKHSNEINIEDL